MRSSHQVDNAPSTALIRASVAAIVLNRTAGRWPTEPIWVPNFVDSRKASRDDGIDSNVTRGKGIRVHQGRCGEGGYFFHRSAVYGEGLENLKEGDGVEFDLGEGPKGPRAENVRRTTT